MTQKRILLHENPERGGEVDPTKPQFTPLIPPFQKPYPLEDDADSYGKTIADCKAKFDNMKPFTGHPFIPPMPPDGGADPYRAISMAGVGPACEEGGTAVEADMVKRPCPECGGEGWVIGTRPSPEPEYDVCEICGGNPPENGDWWCVNPDCQKNTKNDDG